MSRSGKREGKCRSKRARFLDMTNSNIMLKSFDCRLDIVFLGELRFNRCINFGKGKPFFEVVYLNDGSGRVARQCRADVLCPMRGLNFFKRVRLQEHLKVHGEYRQVPFLLTGRPKKGHERQRAGDVDPFLKQRMKRFYAKDRKLAFAKDTHEDRQLAKAEYMWDEVLKDVEKAKFASKEAYIMGFVQARMVAYDMEFHLRAQRTDARIAKGYENQRRKPKCPTEFTGKHEEALNSQPIEQDTPIRREKLPMKGGMKTKDSTKQTPILVPSPSTNPGHVDTSISRYVQGFVEVTRSVATPTEKRRLDDQRFKSEGRVEFRSIISKLVATVDKSMVDGIANNAQACTNVMNLFGMWMENSTGIELVGQSYFLDSLWFGYVEDQTDDAKVESLLSSIDASDLTWIFFPIVKLNHWSLFAWFNPTHKKLSKLHPKKTTLLYMDSFNQMIEPFQCMPTLHRALRTLSKTCTDATLRAQLAMPLLEVEFKCVPSPQQPNGYDCGYYVMTYCMHLLHAGAVKKLDAKKWLTEEWFSHQDVCNLRKDLHKWMVEMGIRWMLPT